MISVSHVSGIGAPVIIRTAWPGATGCSHTTPAPITPSTIYSLQSAEKAMAYPSIADFEKAGTSVGATISSANTYPLADLTSIISTL